MFCPQCRVEYRPGFTRCSDCDLDLVHELPQETHPGPIHEGNLVLLWIGDDLSLHASLLADLDAASIPYMNRSIGNATRSAFRGQISLEVTFPFGFEVAVLSSDLEEAKEILEKLLPH